MDSPRWQKQWEIFHAALEKNAGQRADFLREACGGDDALREEVEALLEGLEASADFMTDVVSFDVNDVEGASPRDPVVGSRIDVYRIRDVIGEGGMGVVYDAQQEEPVHRRVALKLIKLGMDTREVIARFENERQALALMNHPNIANVLDAGVTADGRPYFVMEHVAGVPITDYCDTHRLPIAERLALFTKLCHAVEHAHQKGIIHRDLKPSNVLVAIQDQQPQPKVIDFGVAKALNQRLTDKTLYTELGRFIGTPEYMSPEQAESNGLDVDTRTDIYSLGVLLYALLCGTLPYDDELSGHDYVTVRRTLRDKEPRRPSDHVLDDAATLAKRRTDAPTLRKQLRGDLDWVVMCALDKDRTRRYQTATEFAADIRRFLSDEPVIARPPSAAYRMKKFARRHRVGVLSSLAVLALFATFTAAMTVQSIRLSRALAVADEESERARQEGERATAVSEFLVDLFRETDPARARGREVTVREVLDRGTRQLATQLTEQPLVKATLRETIGEVFLALGDYPQSLENFREALALRQRELGEAHPDTARALAFLGRVEAHEGDYDDAANYYRDALVIQRREWPDGHAELATSLNEYGFVRMLQGQYDDAERLQLEALAIRERLFGDKHEDVALSYNDLAITYRRMSRFDEAERFYRRALEIWRSVYGDDHTQVATVLNNLGVLLHVSGRFEPAEEAFAEALHIRRRQLGEQHYYTGLTLNNLAGVYIEKGRFAYAEELYREALAIYDAALGDDSPESASALSNVARAVYEQGRFEEAVSMLRRALRVRERALEPTNPQIATAKAWLARTLAETGALDEAEALAGEALQAFEASLPAGHWRIALAQSTLGRVYFLQGRLAEAEALLIPSVERLSASRGESAQLTLRSAAFLEEVREASARP